MVTASNVPLFTATITVVVLILDVNDGPPEFSQSSYLFIVSEIISVGSTIGSVTARDPDVLDFVLYSLLPSDTPFIIDFIGNIILISPWTITNAAPFHYQF